MSLYITITHAAAQSGYSLRQFRRLLELGEIPIPVHKFRRKYFVYTADLERWKQEKPKTENAGRKIA